MNIAKFIGMASIAFSISAHSADYLGPSLVAMMQNAYGGWLIDTNGPNANPDNCSKPYAILEPAHPQYTEIYSLLLSAYTTKKELNIYVDGCDSNGYKKISFIYSRWN